MANYAFAEPVLEGQLALSISGAVGRFQASFAGADDARPDYNDILPQAAIRWNSGANNYMTYAQVNVPVGTYDSAHLANFGLGHWGIDAGAGYTYFDPVTGWEFSAVPGFTVNFENPTTRYRNGIDSHIDWAASKLLTDQLQAGLVGYWYQQLTADRGPSLVGDFKSRITAIGPQIGYLFAVGDRQGYVNLKAYHEFDWQNRPGGWNLWVGISISPKSP